MKHKLNPEFARRLAHNSAFPAPRSVTGEIVAIVTASRRTGHWVVTITRRGRTHRYKLSLRRFRWLDQRIFKLGFRIGGSMTGAPWQNQSRNLPLNRAA